MNSWQPRVKDVKESGWKEKKGGERKGGEKKRERKQNLILLVL